MDATSLAGPVVFGVDFTSAPRAAKPITVASGRLARAGYRLLALESLETWPQFESLLARPGPWIGGFDFPFGLPAEAVDALGWPASWPALVRHCRALGRVAFRATLDAYRESRPAGSRYAHRATDAPAGSHSPLKLVNPPVGLMFLEGAPRLADAGVTVPGLAAGDAARIAVEAYPGLAARRITRASYKSDDRAKQTPERGAARETIVRALVDGAAGFGFTLAADSGMLASLVRDASGDRLDAVLAAMQAAWCWKRRAKNYGFPATIHPLEGWIAST